MGRGRLSEIRIVEGSETYAQAVLRSGDKKEIVETRRFHVDGSASPLDNPVMASAQRPALHELTGLLTREGIPAAEVSAVPLSNAPAPFLL